MLVAVDRADRFIFRPVSSSSMLPELEYRPFDIFTFPVSFSLDAGNAFPRASILSSLSGHAVVGALAFINPVSREESGVSAWLEVVRSNFPIDFVSPVARSVVEDHAKVVRPPFLASCVSHSDSSSRVASAAAPVTETTIQSPNLVTWIKHIYLFHVFFLTILISISRLISREGRGQVSNFFTYEKFTLSYTYLVN